MRSQPKFKRSYIELANQSEFVEIGSQHLADNDSIHGSLRNSFDHQNEDIGVSMVVTNQVTEDL